MKKQYLIFGIVAVVAVVGYFIVDQTILASNETPKPSNSSSTKSFQNNVGSGAEEERLVTRKSDNNINLLKHQNPDKKNEGFLFINGKYIEAPYQVLHEKGWILINGIKIKKVSDWPIRLESPGKPQIPAAIIKNAKSFDDMAVVGEKDNWSGRMIRWISRNYKGAKSKSAERITFYKSLPFVDEVKEHSNGNELTLTFKDGSSEIYEFESIPPIEHLTESDVLEEIEQLRMQMESRLASGGTHVFLENGLEIAFGKQKAAKDLKLFYEVLSSDRTNDEKVSIMKRMNIFPEVKTKYFDDFLNSFQASPQLMERVNQLKTDTGISPRTLEDVPALSPAAAERLRIQQK